MRLPIQAAPVPRSAHPAAATLSPQSEAPCAGSPADIARCLAARARVQASGGTHPYRYSASPYDAYSPAYSEAQGVGAQKPY